MEYPVIARLWLIVVAILRRGKRAIFRPLFRSHGRNFVFSPQDIFSYSTISVGDDVYIGPRACFMASNTSLIIGNKVMFGPGVTIMGGDHNTSVVGKFMRDVHEKRPENDQPVTIEDDVWVCCNVTILKGVTIGRGSVIAAGALVTKDVPPYSIACGVPAKVIKRRWPVQTIIEHEKLLYPDPDRFSEEKLSLTEKPVLYEHPLMGTQ